MPSNAKRASRENSILLADDTTCLVRFSRVSEIRSSISPLGDCIDPSGLGTFSNDLLGRFHREETMSLTRRRFVSCAVAGAMPLIGKTAHANSWPSRDIRIIVPFGPGGSADVIARYLANYLKDSFHQNVIVENRTGAGGIIGTNSVVNAEPDGYTLLAISNTITANETMRPNRPYLLMRDLAPVALLNVAYNVLIAHPSVRATTFLADLIKLARGKPGTLNYASSGAGSVYHIIGEGISRFCGNSGSAHSIQEQRPGTNRCDWRFG